MQQLLVTRTKHLQTAVNVILEKHIQVNPCIMVVLDQIIESHSDKIDLTMDQVTVHLHLANMEELMGRILRTVGMDNPARHNATTSRGVWALNSALHLVQIDMIWGWGGPIYDLIILIIWTRYRRHVVPKKYIYIIFFWAFWSRRFSIFRNLGRPDSWLVTCSIQSWMHHCIDIYILIYAAMKKHLIFISSKTILEEIFIYFNFKIIKENLAFIDSKYM